MVSETQLRYEAKKLNSQLVDELQAATKDSEKLKSELKLARKVIDLSTEFHKAVEEENLSLNQCIQLLVNHTSVTNRKARKEQLKLLTKGVSLKKKIARPNRFGNKRNRINESTDFTGYGSVQPDLSYSRPEDNLNGTERLRSFRKRTLPIPTDETANIKCCRSTTSVDDYKECSCLVCGMTIEHIGLFREHVQSHSAHKFKVYKLLSQSFRELQEHCVEHDMFPIVMVPKLVESAEKNEKRDALVKIEELDKLQEYVDVNNDFVDHDKKDTVQQMLLDSNVQEVEVVEIKKEPKNDRKDEERNEFQENAEANKDFDDEESLIDSLVQQYVDAEKEKRKNDRKDDERDELQESDDSNDDDDDVDDDRDVDYCYKENPLHDGDSNDDEDDYYCKKSPRHQVLTDSNFQEKKNKEKKKPKNDKKPEMKKVYFKDMSGSQLKEVLISRNLPASGRKVELGLLLDSDLRSKGLNVDKFFIMVNKKK